MKTHKLLRKFETPTDIMVLGAGFTWQIGNGLGKEIEDLINKVEPHEMGITDDYTSVDIEDTSLETTGSVIVVTPEEFKSLKDLENSTYEAMLYKDFVGEVLLGVINDDTGTVLPLNDPEEDYYILYEIDVENINDINRTAKVFPNGTFSSKEKLEIEGE